jgi:hypothetical protein
MNKLLLTATAVLALASAAAARAGIAAKDGTTSQAMPRPATPDEQRVLAAHHPLTARRSLTKGSIRRMADGADLVELDTAAASYTVATRQADGSLRTDCVTGPDSAVQLVSAGGNAKAKAMPSSTTSSVVTRTEEHLNDR